MSNFIINTLSRVIAGHDIHISKVINENRWICLTYKLSENKLDSQSEVLIRPATQEDLDLLDSLPENKADSGYHIVSQMIRFWNDYGLRCLYVGQFRDDSSPFCWQYFIENSDIHRFKNVKYGAMYQPLAPDAVHLEGGYIPYKLRQKDLFTQFVRSRDRLFYQKGVRLLRCHIACSETKIPMLKFCVKDGWILDHWISEVQIALPFFRSNVFVHHPIKETDFDKFPVPLFHYHPRS